MKGSIKICEIFGIAINIHITFIILPLLFFHLGGFKGLFVILSVFILVTIHELCHSLVARRHGVLVKEITLLPIGGIASMGSLPEKPQQEFEISVAGPLFNILLAILIFLPLYNILGREALFAPSLATWPQAVAYLFWINIALAVFNLLPAFPMDGGRILRSFLTQRIGYLRATKIAVNLGHAFALIFVIIGLPPHGNPLLIVIAVFIYMAASGEEMQVQLKEVLKKFRVRDVLTRHLLTLTPDVMLSRVLEIVFHSHQEDFPVMEGDRMVGFLTRQDIVTSIHKYGTAKVVSEIMRRDFPTAKETDSLVTVQRIMQEHEIKAIPVMKNGSVCGVISLEDIGRVYAMLSTRR